MKIGTQALALLSAFCTFAGVAFAANPMDAGPEVVRGAWCSDFTAAKAVADRDDIPMLVFWANPGCSHCEQLEAACKKEDFRTWQGERQLVMVFGYGKATSDTAACKEFAKNASGQFPYMAVYWKANTAGDNVLVRFSGLSGQMGVDAAQSLQKQLMDAVDAALPDWNPDPEEPVALGGSFLVPDAVGSRLEAIVGRTQSVEVPLVRTNATCAVVDKLVVGCVTNEIVWSVGEEEKSVFIDTSSLSMGEDLVMELYHDDVLVETSSIHGVMAPANACSNPKFLGEEFDYGEWTFDYAAAKAKVAADPEAHLVVTFSGPLWCPYCKGIENTLFEAEAFKTWARENKVALVLMEQGRATSPATALGQRGPRLTTYDHDPNKLGSGEFVSGAAYRSRMGVSEAQATFLINQAAVYTAKWLEPGSTAARLGNPTILLVDPVAEKVNARFNGYREDVGTEKVYDVAENLPRLDAFLAKAGVDESDKYPLTTTLVHEIGAATAVTLDVVESARSYGLVVKPGLVSVALTSEEPGDFTLALYSGNVVIATGVNAVSSVVTSEQVAAGIALKVSKSFGRGERVASAVFASTWTSVDVDNVFVTSVFSRTLALADEGQTFGTLTLSNSRRGKCTIKYFDSRSAKTMSMSGKWSEPDEIGTVSLVMSKLRGKVLVGLEMTSSGEISAYVHDVRTSFDAQDLLGFAHASEMDYSDYAGTIYTVALPVDWSEPTLSSGAGHMIVRADSKSAAKGGKVSCKVVFPNGVTRSLTSQLEPGVNGFANLTVCVRNGKETLIVPMKIRPNALLAPTHRAIVAQEGCDAHWTTSDKKLPFSVSCGIYGSRYDKKESLLDCCGTDRLVLLCDHMDFVPGFLYPEIAGVIGNGEDVKVSDKVLKLANRIQGVSLTYSRSYGTVGGKVRFVFENGRKLTAKLSGIIFHDWHDCGCFDDDDGLPLSRDLAIVLGTCTFPDKVNGRRLTRGIPFRLVQKE